MMGREVVAEEERHEKWWLEKVFKSIEVAETVKTKKIVFNAGLFLIV